MKKFFELLGSAVSFKRRGFWRRGHTPYKDSACNQFYNSLFCDDLSAVQKALGAAPHGVWSTVLAEQPDLGALRAVTQDRSLPSRPRLVAYRRLRDLQEAVVPRELLGSVIEVMLPKGLDVLAAYTDGTVHYIHHSEKISSFEPAPPAWRATISKLSNASQSAVDHIGPWLQPRVAPPTEAMIRMTFLVSDGLYFGQGLLAVMDKDPLAGPIIGAGTDLLKSVTHGSVS
jgi:hypothetical protein